MQTVPEIDIEKAKEKLLSGAAVFVDIRDPGAFQASHIPGARHINDGNVESFVESDAKDKPVIVYCYHGNSSLGAAAYFLNKNFKEVYSMSGGFERWRAIYSSDVESGRGA